MLRHVAVIFFVTFASTVHAQTVVVNDNVSFDFGPIDGLPQFGNSHFSVSKYVTHGPGSACYLAGCDTGMSMQYESQTLQFTTVTLEEQSDWFLVELGDAFSDSSISIGQFPVIFDAGSAWPGSPVGGQVVVGPGDFYLGVRTGAGWDVFPGPPRRNVYGWVHMRPVNGVLTMVENVMSYDSRGIIVGTTTLVPEPSTFASALLGMGLFAAAATRCRVAVKD
jgi:PEP-CTERM motif